MKRYVAQPNGRERIWGSIPPKPHGDKWKYSRTQSPQRQADPCNSAHQPGNPFARMLAFAAQPLYVIELAIKMSPMPISVQRKEQPAAEALYQQVRQTLEQGQPRLLELTCEKVEGKRVSVLSSEILAVQIYEKTAAGGGSKRPGFAFDG